MANESTLTFIKNLDTNVFFDKADTKAITELCAKIVAQAKTFAPADKGRLRNSIMYKLENSHTGGFNDSSDEKAENKIEGKPGVGEGFVGFNLEYGIYQEFGTRNMAPQPFLRPAIAIYQGQKAVDIIKKIHEEELRGSLKPGQKRETFF